MATIKYLIRSQANRHVPIYFYASLGRGSFFRMKTGFNILPKNWSSVKGFPKPNDEENKRLMERLKSLESFLMEKVNEAQAKGIDIDKSFFERQVDECFNRVKPTNKTLLSNHIKHIIETAPTRKIKGKNKIGLSENTVKNYNTFLKVVLNYEKHLGKPIHFLDIDFNFIEGFKNWLINDQKYSVNSSGKSLAFIKSISIDAEKHGVSVNPFVNKIEAFSEANEDRYIITLTFGELDQIRNADLKREALINARKWLLLGCEIGQRVEDLLKITEANLRRTSQGTFIDLKQNKTKKDVTIAEEAKLNELVKGKKYDKSSKRKVLGNFPKHELITSHACRRSFATNYYKIIPTTILMGITGHTKESTFLVYINKPKDRDENARLFLDMMKRVG